MVRVAVVSVEIHVKLNAQNKNNHQKKMCRHNHNFVHNMVKKLKDLMVLPCYENSVKIFERK